ncbi:PEPxxWA-CTERM sorting domain-containing protein [Oxalobacteraceae bacterium OTU3CINTB1]|nr:PEPxxWA-CTERM sorting domain-containing protein [Oxalobacteraceae bacterium OTU3CINTB1]
MNKITRTFACAALLAGSAAAQAGSFAFEYTMLDNTRITGSFDGTANGNLVEGISKLAIAVNGFAMPNSGNLYAYATDGGYVQGDARISFDGLATSLLAFDGPVTGVWTSSFIIGAFNGGDTDAINYNIAGLPFNGEGDGDYSASRWSLTTVSAVPEPATYAMLLGGLALIGALARRRNPSA